MRRAVSSADANRRLSELLRTVKTGRTVVATSHGTPVARLMPIPDDDRAAEGARVAPRVALFARLRTERVVKAGRSSRHEQYHDRVRT